MFLIVYYSWPNSKVSTKPLNSNIRLEKFAVDEPTADIWSQKYQKIIYYKSKSRS